VACLKLRRPVHVEERRPRWLNPKQSEETINRMTMKNGFAAQSSKLWWQTAMKKGQTGPWSSRFARVRWRVEPTWALCIQPFPANFARGCSHNLNSWHPGHQVTTLPLRQGSPWKLCASGNNKRQQSQSFLGNQNTFTPLESYVLLVNNKRK
jgi:hypothetical protein